MPTPESLYLVDTKDELAEVARYTRLAFVLDTRQLVFRRDDGAWSVVSGRGPTGEPGESIKGEKGDKGDPGPEREVRVVEKVTHVPVPGPKGDPGPSSTIPGPRGLPGERGPRGAIGHVKVPPELTHDVTEAKELAKQLAEHVQALTARVAAIEGTA